MIRIRSFKIRIAEPVPSFIHILTRNGFGELCTIQVVQYSVVLT